MRGNSTAADKTLRGSAVDLAGVRGRSVTDDGAKSRSVKRSPLNGNTPALIQLLRSAGLLSQSMLLQQCLVCRIFVRAVRRERHQHDAVLLCVIQSCHCKMGGVVVQ